MRPIIFVCGRNRRDRDRHHHLILIICLLRYKVFFLFLVGIKKEIKLGDILLLARDGIPLLFVAWARHFTSRSRASMFPTDKKEKKEEEK